MDVTTSVEAGLQRVRQAAWDIVICRHQLQTGTAFDVLEVLQGIPALVLVRPGLEAMRHAMRQWVCRLCGYRTPIPTCWRACLGSRAVLGAAPAPAHGAEAMLTPPALAGPSRGLGGDALPMLSPKLLMPCSTS